MSVWAILVAAGRGERLGLDQPKAFAKLGEDPLLAEPLRRLEESDWVDAIVLVAPPGWEEPAILLAEELGCGKVSACVPGGETRADSVRAGLAEVPADAVVVLVHDAARPLLPEEVIERVLAPLSEGWDGAVPGLPVADTLKRVGADGAIAETVSRDGLWAVQTPQAFPADVLRRAVAGGGDATDCAALVEARGGRVKGRPGRCAAAQGDDGRRPREDRRMASVTEYRVGTGFDAHAFEDGVPLVLGGVRIEHPRGLAGPLRRRRARARAHRRRARRRRHGGHRRALPVRRSGAEGRRLARAVARAWSRVQEGGWELVNADVVLIGEEPRLAPHRDAMRARLADALGVEPERVAVRATTTDGLGFTGRGEGLAAQAVALLRR